MIKRIFSSIVFFSIIIFTACNSHSQEESIIKPILSEFQEAGISLKEKTEKSPSFSFSGSDEKHYEFNGGNIYLIYTFGNKDRIVDKLTTLFAEAEFPYGVKSLYTDKFIIVFIASSEHLDTKEKIENIFPKIKED